MTNSAKDSNGDPISLGFPILNETDFQTKCNFGGDVWNRCVDENHLRQSCATDPLFVQVDGSSGFICRQSQRLRKFAFKLKGSIFSDSDPIQSIGYQIGIRIHWLSNPDSINAAIESAFPDPANIYFLVLASKAGCEAQALALKPNCANPDNGGPSAVDCKLVWKLIRVIFQKFFLHFLLRTLLENAKCIEDSYVKTCGADYFNIFVEVQESLIYPADKNCKLDRANERPPGAAEVEKKGAK